MARKSIGIGERHRKIYEFLVQFQRKNGYSPSIREIGENINVQSTSLVDYYLKQLEENGFIDRGDHISRSIRITREMPVGIGGVTSVLTRVADTVEELLRFPIQGRIVASAPIPVPSSSGAYFDQESTVEIARSLIPARENLEELYALEVSGDSMIDAMINDGDVVIMRKAVDANNGELVAVWLDDKEETTLKYFYKEGNRVRLQPANPTMSPIYIDDPQHLRIMGKVVIVIRQVKHHTGSKSTPAMIPGQN